MSTVNENFETSFDECKIPQEIRHSEFQAGDVLEFLGGNNCFSRHPHEDRRLKVGDRITVEYTLEPGKMRKDNHRCVNYWIGYDCLKPHYVAVFGDKIEGEFASHFKLISRTATPKNGSTHQIKKFPEISFAGLVKPEIKPPVKKSLWKLMPVILMVTNLISMGIYHSNIYKFWRMDGFEILAKLQNAEREYNLAKRACEKTPIANTIERFDKTMEFDLAQEKLKEIQKVFYPNLRRSYESLNYPLSPELTQTRR